MTRYGTLAVRTELWACYDHCAWYRWAYVRNDGLRPSRDPVLFPATAIGGYWELRNLITLNSFSVPNLGSHHTYRLVVIAQL